MPLFLRAHFVPKRIKRLDCPFLIVRGQMGIALYPIERLAPYKVHYVIQREPPLDKPGSERMTQIVETDIQNTGNVYRRSL